MRVVSLLNRTSYLVTSRTQPAGAAATTAVVVTRRRGMAGGPIPARYKVKKNKYVEEWNGKREITEKTFTVDPSMAANLLLYVVALPYGAYTLTRSEFQSKGDRRYKDCV